MNIIKSTVQSANSIIDLVPNLLRFPQCLNARVVQQDVNLSCYSFRSSRNVTQEAADRGGFVGRMLLDQGSRNCMKSIGSAQI